MDSNILFPPRHAYRLPWKATIHRHPLQLTLGSLKRRRESGVSPEKSPLPLSPNDFVIPKRLVSHTESTARPVTALSYENDVFWKTLVLVEGVKKGHHTREAPPQREHPPPGVHSVCPSSLTPCHELQPLINVLPFPWEAETPRKSIAWSWSLKSGSASINVLGSSNHTLSSENADHHQ